MSNNNNNPSSISKPNTKLRAMLLPGNGFFKINSIWYPWLGTELEKLGIQAFIKTFPDPLEAKRSIWIPFVNEIMGGFDKNCILIGHSSGAACALRIAEEHPLCGIVLISGYDNHLGDSLEKKSGYFDDPWNWEKIRENTDWIVQFHSADDHLVPLKYGKRVADAINSDLILDEHEGHYNFKDSFPQLIEKIKEKLNQQ